MDNYTQSAKNTSALWMLFYAVLVFIVGILACFVWLRHSGKSAYVSFSEPAFSDVSENESLKKKQEIAFAQKITTLLENILGKDKVRVEVNLDMSFDHITTNEEIFDPHGKVVKSRYSEPEASNIKESIQYEVNKFTRNQIRNTGVIKKISAIVLIDGIYERTPGGTIVYHQRTNDEMKQLTALIEPALGYNPQRGDVLKVENIPFADSRNIFTLFKVDILEISILIVVVLMALLLLGKNRREEISVGESVKLSSCDIKRVQDSIDANPVAAIKIIREWLTEENGDS